MPRTRTNTYSSAAPPRRSPWKTLVWLDLMARQEKGEAVDAKSIRKHANDVLRLAQLLAPETRIAVVAKIAQDLALFLLGIAKDDTIDPRAFGSAATLAEISVRIRQAYGLPSPQ